MNRNEALAFIRDNSRLIADLSLPKSDRSYEHRIGNNATAFILLDMGIHGWELFFINEGNNVDKTITAFCKITEANFDPEDHTEKQQIEHDQYLADTLEDNGDQKASAEG